MIRIGFWSVLLVAVFLLLGLAVAWMMYDAAPRAYQASGTFVVDELPFVQTAKQPDAETDRQLVQTLILSIANRDMRNAVADRLGVPAGRISFSGIDRPLKLGPGEPQANVEVSAVKSTRMGSITADSQTPEFAARVVNAIIDELQLYNVIGGRIQAVQTNARFLKAKADSMIQQLVDVTSQRIKLEKENAEMENYMKQSLPLWSFPSFSTDATLINLKTQFILVESEYKSLAATSTRGPRLEGKAAELKTLRDLLAAQAASLSEGLRAEYAIRLTQEQNLQADQRATAGRLDELSQQATRLAQSFGDPSQMRDLAAEHKQDASVGPANMIVVVDRASPPPRPFRPKLVFYLLLGGALGAMVGLGLAALRIVLDNSIKSVAQVETILPCLAVLPARQPLSLAAFAAEDHPDFPAGLGFLCSHLISPSDLKTPSIVGFTSVSPRQRSSALVADLAILLAQAGKRTLVLDLHFERPSIAKSLGVDVRHGLETWMLSREPLAGFVNLSASKELAVLSVKKRSEGLVDRISRRPFAAEWKAIAADWDFILIDGPCTLTDWSLSLSLPSGAPLIFTADFRRTKMDTLVQACSHARGPHWKLEGLVLTNAPRRIAG